LFQRNKPVFLIGIVTVGIFLFIILTSQLRPPTKPTLIGTDQQELVAEHTNIKGPFNAQVTIVEFTDFGCPACKAYHPVMKELVETYPEQLRWAVRHFPLPTHKNADQAARAAQAAGNQGRFWEFQDILYENPDDFEEGDFVRYADLLGMDLGKIRQDYNDRGIKQQVQQDISYGTGIGINSTPTFFLNGKQLELTGPEDLRYQIEQELTSKNVNVEELKEQKVVEEKEELQQEYTEVYNAVDDRFGTKEIEFIDGNFKPRNAQAYAGQVIKWVNKSAGDITFVQIKQDYPELAEPFVIKAGESFEFRLRLRDVGMWTYRNEGNVARASIMINKLSDNMAKLIPDEN